MRKVICEGSKVLVMGSTIFGKKFLYTPERLVIYKRFALSDGKIILTGSIHRIFEDGVLMYSKI